MTDVKFLDDSELANIKTLDEALLFLQADPPVLKKDKAGQVGSQKTKYADLVQVNREVLSRLNRMGVVYKAKPTLRDGDPKFVLAYSLVHVPSGTSEEGDYPLKLSENPQQMGSAITYARRYALLAITGIAAEDEDDDGRASNQRTAQRAAQPQPDAERPTARRAASGPALPGEDNNLITPQQLGKIQGLFREQGYATSDDRHAFIVTVLPEGRTVSSTKDLTRAEASAVIERLLKREDPAAAGDVP